MEQVNYNAELQPQIISLTNQGRRSSQQDRLWPSPTNESSAQLENKDILLIVADGAGGHQGGEIASQIAIDVIPQSYLSFCQQGQPADVALNDAIIMANNEVRGQQIKEPDKSDMASTVVALAMTPEDKIWIANVGDSRAYIFRPDQGLKQLSVDHTLVQDQVRLGNLDPEIAKNHPLRHRLSQALGGSNHIDIALVKINQVTHDDRYLLCSDGLTDVLTDQEIAQILADRQSPLQQVAQRLMAQALHNVNDNISFILMGFAPPQAKVSAVPITKPQAASTPSRKRLGLYIVGCALMLLVICVPIIFFSILNGEINTISSFLFNEEVAGQEQQTAAQVTQPTATPLSSPVVSVPSATSTLQATMPVVVAENTPTEDILRVNDALIGEAMTSTPPPPPPTATFTPQPPPPPTSTPIPLAKIVEYRASDRAVVFESMVGWGGGQYRTCYNLATIPSMAERLSSYYANATFGVSQPRVETHGDNIHVIFDANSTEVQACGQQIFDEGVTFHITEAYPNGVWIIEYAMLTGGPIPLDPDPNIAQGGWVIYVHWKE